VGFLNFIYVFFNKKWFFDRLQNELILSPLLKMGYSTTYKIIDKGVIEFFGPSGIIKLTLNLSKQVSLFQSGKINQYAFLMFVLLMVCISFSLFLIVFNRFIELEIVVLILLSISFSSALKR